MSEEDPQHAEEEPTTPILDELVKTTKNLHNTVSAEFRANARTAKFSIIITLIGFLATVISVILPIMKSVERVEKDIMASRFKITQPGDGETVDLTAVVRGQTPFPEINNYVIVTALKTGDSFIEDGPVKSYAGGLWTGRAKFGAAGVGSGEEFVVRGLATKSVLIHGPLTGLPEDAIFSDPIIVTRKK